MEHGCLQKWATHGPFYLSLYFVQLHSHQKGVPKVGLIGEGRLIAGIEKGIVGMCINERRKVTVPSHLAYGAAGAGNSVANVTYSSCVLHPHMNCHSINTNIKKTWVKFKGEVCSIFIIYLLFIEMYLLLTSLIHHSSFIPTYNVLI